MGFELVCMCMLEYMGREVMMNTRTAKVSRGEAVDGKAPMTAKLTTQEKVA